MEKRASISVLAPCWNSAAFVYALTSSVVSNTPKAPELGVDHALGHPLAVEVGHLLDEVHVVQHDRTVGPPQ